MLIVNAEAQAAQDVAEAIEELCILASRLGCMVTVKFNDVGLTAKPGADPRELLAKWKELVDSKRAFKYACAQPVELPRAWQQVGK
jgi:hypothetical protein